MIGSTLNKALGSHPTYDAFKQNKKEGEVKVFANSILEQNHKPHSPQNTKTWKVSKESNIKILGLILCTILKKVFLTLAEKIEHVFRKIFKKENHLDEHKLFQTDHKINTSEHAWYLNKGLMRDIYDRTDDPELKRRIQFLTTNYLSKAAPVYLDLMKTFIADIEPKFQVSPHIPFHYHRYGFLDNLNIGLTLNQDFALKKNSPLIPTDTTHFDELLPLSFNVMNEQNRDSWSDHIADALFAHFEKYLDNPEKGLEELLSLNLLFDLTSILEKTIKTDNDKEKENDFNLEFKQCREDLNMRMNMAIDKVREKYPQIPVNKLQRFIRKNSTGICRVKGKNDVPGIKILPLYSNLKGKNLLKNQNVLTDFLAQTGLFIGALNMRRNLVDEFHSESNKEVHYAVQKGNPNALYFEKKEDFSNLALFRRLTKKMLEEKDRNPHIHVLGMTTLELVNGVLNEMNQEQWDALNQEGPTRELLQTSLFRIREHLATAELWMDSDFTKFTQAIELVHSEMTTLLELAPPFSSKAFPEIYKSNLTKVPASLKKYVKVGLGKTGMNVFAGINAGILNNTKKPTRAYGKGFYFEQAGFIGNDHTIGSVLKDTSITKVDLIGCQFNPNIEIAADHTHYEVGHVAEDIKKLLEAKKDIKHLTVAVDCTIDFINSEKVHKLLDEFKKEIEEGKLNFVFFRSGQKLDMFGMDNYYGAPFFIVNNGSDHWKSFNKTMLEAESLKTDSLSYQWFCLANRYASSSLEDYRRLIFTNTREILKNIPEHLKQKKSTSQSVRVNTVDTEMDPCFIDIKVTGRFHKIRALFYLASFYYNCLKNGTRPQTRASFGFFDPNCLVISINEVKGSSTIRLTPGINPKDNETILEYLKTL